MKSFKRILYTFIAVFLIALTSCEKKYETEGLSSKTYYAVFTITGDQLLTVALGSNYSDPGCTADANGTDIPVDVSVKGNYQGYSGSTVDANTADQYIVSYSAENADGYVATAEREVWVADEGDFVNSIAGLYTSTVVRNGSTSPQYTDMQYVLVWEKSAGVFQISDAIGGYYNMGRGYGVAYTAQGMTITANDISANDFSWGGPIVVGPWPEALTVTDVTADAASKTLTVTSSWDAGYEFVVTLTQVEL